MGEYDGLVELAWERYHEEPLFHARVHHAVQAVRTQALEDGFTWPEQFDGILKASAATALLMTEIHDEETGEINTNGMARDSGRAEGSVEQSLRLVETDPNTLN